MERNAMPARRRLALAALIVAAAAATPAALYAQTGQWPTRPVKLVVPFPPGGSTDAIGRLLAVELARIWARPSSSRTRAAPTAISARTRWPRPSRTATLLLSGVGSNAINYALYASMPYRDSDFAHVSLLATGPNVLVAAPDFPGKTFADFIRLARERTNTHASSGSGSSGHLAMEMLKQQARIDLVHVPYKGGAAAITDLLGGRVTVLFLNQDTLLPQVQAGKLRALAVASVKRNPAYPDTPTVAESGYPGFAAESWFGLSAPARTPPAVIQRLSQATAKAMASAEMRQKLESVGFVVVGSDPQAYSGFVTSEIAKWGQAAKASGARMD